MNFKKLALIAAMATSFGAFAENVGVLPAAEDSAYAAADAQPLLQAELIADTATVEGNQAYVVQEGEGSLSYISQASAEGSFAAIVQMGVGAMAMVYQTGDLGSKALIVQRGVSTTNDVALYDVTAADTEAKALALALNASKPVPTVVMNEDANVAFIHQTADGGINVAYIDQSGTETSTVDSNFAAIVQNAGTGNNLGMIVQVGSFNKAVINQVN